MIYIIFVYRNKEKECMLYNLINSETLNKIISYIDKPLASSILWVFNVKFLYGCEQDLLKNKFWTLRFLYQEL